MARAFADPRHASREKAADRAAAAAVSRMEAATAPLTRRSSTGTTGVGACAGLETPWLPLGTAMGHDFSRVRVHTAGTPSALTHALGARAVTVGTDIAFAPGEWAPRTRSGRTLLAHELAHVVMQAREGAPRLDAKTPDEELDEELRKHAARDPTSLDPDNPEYARTLQDYGSKLTHQGAAELQTEPKDLKAKAEWRKRFAKSELLAGRILSRSGPQVDQKEERVRMLASDLATAGFVDEAMALARQITKSGIRVLVYASALDRPDKLTPPQMAEITKFHVSRQTPLVDHPVLQRLRGDKGGYAKQLTPEKINAALAELVEGYENDAALPGALAEVLYFHPGSRPGFTTRMIGDRKGALLRKVSDKPHFKAGTPITTSAGVVNPSQATVAWAVANKQKVAVQDILDLTSAARLPIKPPKAFDAASLKAWLDMHTETIGQAIKKQHPADRMPRRRCSTRSPTPSCITSTRRPRASSPTSQAGSRTSKRADPRSCS
jgi:hypothetical protein